MTAPPEKAALANRTLTENTLRCTELSRSRYRLSGHRFRTRNHTWSRANSAVATCSVVVHRMEPNQSNTTRSVACAAACASGEPPRDCAHSRNRDMKVSRGNEKMPPGSRTSRKN
eukprot:9507768-Alexandrium_andersonii.AAC.1